MKTVSLIKVDVKFECPSCGKDQSCNVVEAVENGPPVCPDCEEVMDIIECEVDTFN